jgi:hypothetical protein
MISALLKFLGLECEFSGTPFCKKPCGEYCLNNGTRKYYEDGTQQDAIGMLKRKEEFYK